jgi:hypothetical protein
MDYEAKRLALEGLRKQVQQLEAELSRAPGASQWPPQGYYAVYHVLAGFVLGMFGAATSLVFNVVGSLLVGQDPLWLIRVYLTFPLGATALEPFPNDRLMLAIGCCLYLGTGMVLGMPFNLVLTRWLPNKSFAFQLLVISAMALFLWVFNYYAILAWLQPVLFGGQWIVQLIPWWVGALTHLVFGWTMLLVQPLGRFVPYSQGTEAS